MATLTHTELEPIPDGTIAYKQVRQCGDWIWCASSVVRVRARRGDHRPIVAQVGKMFLAQPLPKLKEELLENVAACEKVSVRAPARSSLHGMFQHTYLR